MIFIYIFKFYMIIYARHLLRNKMSGLKKQI